MKRPPAQWLLITGVLFLLVLLVACEPLAPNAQPQPVIVVTNTFTAVPASPTALLATPLPTRIPPTATPTVVLNPTATVAPCDETQGRLVDSVINSAVAGELVEYQVYVPPCFYITGRRYPYVILMHGSGYTHTQWTEDLQLQQVMDQGINNLANPMAPMVLVMPTGGQAQEFNIFDVGASYEDFILDELIPEVERLFCVWNEPQGRAIGGISRGGFWAFSIAFRYLDRFTAVGGHSPFFDADNAPPTHNPLNLAQNVPSTTNLSIFLDNAQSDSGGPTVIQLSNTLRANNVFHTYEISPTGGHDNDYWGTHLQDYLRFYGNKWPKNVAELPSCF